MTIRCASHGDRALLLDLWERSVRATHLFLSETDIVALKPLVASALASNSPEWRVAADGGRPFPIIHMIRPAPR